MAVFGKRRHDIDVGAGVIGGCGICCVFYMCRTVSAMSERTYPQLRRLRSIPSVAYGRLVRVRKGSSVPACDLRCKQRRIEDTAATIPRHCLTIRVCGLNHHSYSKHHFHTILLFPSLFLCLSLRYPPLPLLQSLHLPLVSTFSVNSFGFLDSSISQKLFSTSFVDTSYNIEILLAGGVRVRRHGGCAADYIGHCGALNGTIRGRRYYERARSPGCCRLPG